MTSQTSLSSLDPHPAGPPVGRRPTPTRLAAAAATVAAGMALGWLGGAAGLAGVLASAALLPWLLCRGSASDGGFADDALADDQATLEPRVNGGRVGSEVMVHQVVPVWGKQLEVTRSAAAEGLSALLETFSQMASTLNSLGEQLENNHPTLQAGALDEVLADDSPGRAAMTALCGPSQRAFAQRDAAVAELVRCADAVNELRQLGRQSREIGKHTRLVALNASIEANRGSSGGGSRGQGRGAGTESGSQAVANETRMLAERMAEVGEHIERVVARLDRTLGPERLRGDINDTTAEELRLELDLRAREALNALLGNLGDAMRSSGEVRAAADALRGQIENTFVQFQFGDRVSQMLAIVGDDMQNFARWVSANPYATQSDAAEWLANLEKSYTMDEQRSQHHGNVHIDRGSEIEFF